MLHFPVPIGIVAGGVASEGQRKASQYGLRPPLLRLSSRDNWDAACGEQELIQRMVALARAAGLPFSRTLIVTCYVSLKTNPFVLLTGIEGAGKTELVTLFAEALLGHGSPQFALINGDSSWLTATGDHHSFRSLFDRFTSLRFLELLQEAADPGSAGKAFIVCFSGLLPEEVNYYFTTLLSVDEEGRKRLQLPGIPEEDRPVVPPNVSITATVHTAECAGVLHTDVLRQAGVIAFRVGRVNNVMWRPLAPPPVGLQRLWLRVGQRDPLVARDHLLRIIGATQWNRMGCSEPLASALRRAGIALTPRLRQDVMRYVANSFDEEGRGLFDPDDALRNAQIAFDSQVAQRLIWHLRDALDPHLLTGLMNDPDASRPLAWAG
jgi:energy-coupling factor transporter ATP-binding protein EcfA2